MIYNTSTPPKNGFFYFPKPLQPNTIICFYDRNSETFFNSGKCQLMNNNQYKIEAKPTFQPLKITQHKKLINDLEITEFLIQEIQNPILYKGVYAGICEILTRLYVYNIITKIQLDNFYQNYIENSLKKGCVFLFPITEVKPRVKFLQNLLKNLQKT